MVNKNGSTQLNHTLKTILCLALFFLAISMTSCNKTGMPTETSMGTQVSTNDPLQPYIDYLKDNSVPLSKLSEQDSSYTRFSNYKLILAGEHHGIKKSFDAELMLLKYLNQTQNVRYILLEIGYCTGELLNQYLDSGDETILQTILGNLKGTSAYSEEYYAFYKAIYDYNNSLDTDVKLQLQGVDVEHQFATGVNYIVHLLPETTPPESISAPLKTLTDQISYTERELSNLKNSIQEYKDIYRTYLGEEVFERFNRAVERMEQGIEYYTNDSSSYREECLINNTIEILETYPDETFYGIFGSFHTALSNTDDVGNPCLANYLNNNYTKTAGKIASITFAYHNSKYRSSQKVAKVDETFRVVTKAAQFLPDEISFCPLDLPESPFGAEGERSLKSQQYLVMICNSPETSIYISSNY